MLKITNGKIIIGDEVVASNLYIDGGKIAEITDADKPCDRVIDAGGSLVSPGFIDTHVHGGGNADVMDGVPDALRTAAKTHLKRGTTSICLTTTASTFDELMPVLNSYLEILPESGKGMPNLIGMHLEGPNFSPKQAGAQDPRRIYPPRPEEYTRVLEMMRGNIAKWSFAPELPGAVEFCRELVKYGVMPCIGHTDATYDEVMQVYPEGANCLTHFYSSMSGITRKDGYRVAGVIESGYILDDMWVEVIADGSHIPPLLLGMIFKLKDINKIMLVTDAMRGATMPDGPSILGVETECIIEDGIAKMPDRTCFAGSVATTDRLVRTVYKSVGMPICAAIKMMCENPARALGLGTKGRIAVGYDADIVIFDDNVNVQTVIVGGEIQQF